MPWILFLSWSYSLICRVEHIYEWLQQETGLDCSIFSQATSCMHLPAVFLSIPVKAYKNLYMLTHSISEIDVQEPQTGINICTEAYKSDICFSLNCYCRTNRDRIAVWQMKIFLQLLNMQEDYGTKIQKREHIWCSKLTLGTAVGGCITSIDWTCTFSLARCVCFCLRRIETWREDCTPPHPHLYQYILSGIVSEWKNTTWLHNFSLNKAGKPDDWTG